MSRFPPHLALPDARYGRGMVALPAVRTLMATPDFRRLFGSRLVGQFGDGLLQASLATFVLFSPERQPDAIKVAAAFAILLLPYSIIGPFAGVLLDRWRRRTVLVRANGLKALLVLPVIALVAAADDGPLLGIAVLAVLGVGRFVLAGLSASLPHVVSGPDLVTANALTPTSGTILAAIGAGVGVLLRGLVGGGDGGSMVVLAASAVAYLVAGAIALRIRPDTLGPDHLGPDRNRPDHLGSDRNRPDHLGSDRNGPSRETMRGIVVGLVDGVRVLLQHRPAARAIAVVGVNRVAFGLLTAGGLLLVRTTLHPAADADDALRDFSLLTGAAAAGALVGALLTPWASRRWSVVTWSAFTMVQAGLVGTALVIAGAQQPSLALLLGGAASCGFAGQSVKVCSDTVVQRDIPDDHLGRVFTLFDMIVNVCLVSGIVLMALISPTSGQTPVLYAAMGIGLLGAAAAYLRTRPRRVPSST